MGFFILIDSEIWVWSYSWLRIYNAFLQRNIDYGTIMGSRCEK